MPASSRNPSLISRKPHPTEKITTTAVMFENIIEDNITAGKQQHECINVEDKYGVKYRGTQSETKRGAPCVRWDSLTLWNKFHPSKNQEKDLSQNFCRNPDGDNRGPWCFVSLAPRKFQYCSISVCMYMISKTLIFS